MSGEDDDLAGLRHKAAEEVDLCYVDLLHIGSLFGTAIEAHSDRLFALGHDLLSDRSSPENWIRNGVASWIRCYDAQVELYRGLCDVVCHSTTGGKKLFNGMRNGNAIFTLDVFGEGVDPFATPIPPAQRQNVTVVSGPNLAPHIRLTLSADDAGNQVVKIGLVGLHVNPDPLPPGTRRATTLVWPGGTMKVTATRLRPPAG
ncbi:MAG TPA: hypothetical protein VN903_27550 [Polyangia bacterium]|jgi:hypothetical protein|nr:hypothetical protein [Polyangia bacterium]